VKFSLKYVAGWLPYSTLLLSSLLILPVSWPLFIAIAIMGLWDFLWTAALLVLDGLIGGIGNGSWLSFAQATACAALTALAMFISLRLFSRVGGSPFNTGAGQQ
jgi:hypothetical protein